MNGSINWSCEWDWHGSIQSTCHCGVPVLFIHRRDFLSSICMRIDHGRSLDVTTKASVSYLGTTLSYLIYEHNRGFLNWKNVFVIKGNSLAVYITVS